MEAAPELKVFISNRDSTCEECQAELGKQAWIHLAGERGALCLDCADLAHLAFLPSGNTALTRRAKKYSQLHAVVLKWSRSRNRYERQGLLVEEEGLARAEGECLANAEVRERRRGREQERRDEIDQQFAERFASRIRDLFPGCPPDREQLIAQHACQKYSGRVGRSAAAKDLEEAAIRLAVIAHVRHRETDYDTRLGVGEERHAARHAVQASVEAVLQSWGHS